MASINGPSDVPKVASPGIKHVKFDGRILMVGLGSVGLGTLPLVLRHFDMPASKITIFTLADRAAQAKEVSARYGVNTIIEAFTPENYKQIMANHVGPGDLLINVSVNVSSVALIEECAKLGVLYLDTCIEPWAGGYEDPSMSPSQRSNYALRHEALNLGSKLERTGPTAVLTHGANPGLVNTFVKQALLNIAHDTGVVTPEPTTQAGWADLADHLGIKAIHIAERDTQVSSHARGKGEFMNTWSIDGFISEGFHQPAELGWGTHEKELPPRGAHHEFGDNCGIYINRPGALTRVRTWVPDFGAFHGCLVTHSEAISLASYLTKRGDDGQVLYRPTVHYAYHPSDAAMASVDEMAGKSGVDTGKHFLMGCKDIVDGIDELGVLLMGHAKGAYWYGSQLSTKEARELCDYNSGTSLQICSAVLAGAVWAVENPRRGVVEPEDMDRQRIMDITLPYLGPVVGKYTDWTPLQGRGELFPEEMDTSDPWQFKNILVRF